MPDHDQADHALIATELPVLSTAERACLDRYVARLREVLGADLEGVWVFGSVARGERWPSRMPIRSDVDLLVVTSKPADAATADALIDETYPLFLECGRQIGPQFRTSAWLRRPPDERSRDFVARVREEAIPLWQGVSELPR